MPIRMRVALITSLTVISSLLAVGSAGAVVTPQKVVIIVGPTGGQTDDYRHRGDDYATTATAAGANVVKVYSPNATWANVKAAVDGANIVIYLGHGNGYPNPYNSGAEPTDRDNGWGLNRTTAGGDDDNWGSTMVYCGEQALLGMLTPGSAAQWAYCGGSTNTDGITPAPNWVMIYSNACYAPGASEGFDVPATEAVALQRVRNYSYPDLMLGAGAYFATDMGASGLIDTILRNPEMPFGAIAESANGYDISQQRHFDHPDLAGYRIWIQNSGAPTSGSYKLAYAGRLSLTPSGSTVAYVEPKPAGTTDFVFDVTGYFSSAQTGATYLPLTPARLLDSRFGNGLSGKFGANAPRTFQVSGRGGVPGNAVAVTGNFTVTNQTAAGAAFLGPNSTASPTTSTINFPVGDNRANGVTLALGSGGTLSATYMASSGTTDFVFDVTGYFVAAGGSTYLPLTPARLLDSRFGNGLSGAFSANAPRTFQVSGRGGVPAGAVAVSGNFTVTNQTSAGAAFLGPDSTATPSTSTLNFPVGDSRANGVILALGPGGTLSATYMSSGGSSDFVFDVTGYFMPGQGGATYVPLTPATCRVPSRSAAGAVSRLARWGSPATSRSPTRTPRVPPSSGRTQPRTHPPPR